MLQYYEYDVRVRIIIMRGDMQRWKHFIIRT